MNNDARTRHCITAVRSLADYVLSAGRVANMLEASEYAYTWLHLWTHYEIKGVDAARFMNRKPPGVEKGAISPWKDIARLPALNFTDSDGHELIAWMYYNFWAWVDQGIDRSSLGLATVPSSPARPRSTVSGVLAETMAEAARTATGAALLVNGNIAAFRLFAKRAK